MYRRGKITRRIMAAALVAVLGMTNCQSAFATTLSNAKDKKQEAEKNLDSVKQNISDIESKQAALQTEIDKVDADLVNLLVNIDILNGELDDKKAEVKQINGDLKEAKAEEKTQYKNMKKRIRYMYENGNGNMVSALIGSKSMADLLNNVEYVNDIYDYDRNLLEDYQATVKKVNDLRTQAKEEQAELEGMQRDYKEQQNDLEAMKADKQGKMADFNSTLARAKDLAGQYKATIEEQNKVIRAEEAKAAEAAKAAQKAQTAAAPAAKGNGTASTPAADPAPAPAGSGNGSAVAQFACQFVGNPYVWGGTSLTNGCDCSGFVMSVYAHFGVSLPHSSGALAGCGRAVSYAEAQPGDLICYSGHVAIYIGGGAIVHASTEATGIKISPNAAHRQIVAVRRIF